MEFHEMKDALKSGRKIKLKPWKNAYWIYKDGVIINHDEVGVECPVSKELSLWGLACVLDDRWEIVDETPTKKLFISQPMNGKTDDAIQEVREEAIRKAKKQLKCNVVVIDSYIKDASNSVKPLWYLGKSLEFLAEADVAYFAQGWKEARGCKIEHECAVQYGIPCIEETQEDK